MTYFIICILWGLYAVYKNSKKFPKDLFIDFIVVFLVNMALMPLMVIVWLLGKL